MQLATLSCGFTLGFQSFGWQIAQQTTDPLHALLHLWMSSCYLAA
jgi:hypothetical protein